MSAAPVRVAVMASGGGTNLQALLDRFNERGSAAARVVLVVTDREDAGALGRAVRAGVPGRVLAVKGREPEDIATELLAVLHEHEVEVVALAGYLKLVPAAVVRGFAGRMVNVHPALLPAFGGPGYYGRRVHQAVLDAGCRVTGATVHLVDEEYDRGRILAQYPVPVLAGDTAETLAARVLRVEHLLFPAALERLALRLRESTDDAASGPGGAGPRAGGAPTLSYDAVEAAAPSVRSVERAADVGG